MQLENKILQQHEKLQFGGNLLIDLQRCSQKAA